MDTEMQTKGAAAADGSGSEATQQFVTFEVGEQLFGFPMERIREIVRMPTLTDIPLTGDELMGLANLRGRVVPVLDTSALLANGERAASESERVVVLDGAAPTGFRVDCMARVLQVVPESVGSVEGLEGSVDTDLLCGIAHDERTGLILLLDPEEMLNKGLSVTPGKEAMGSGLAAGLAPGGDSEASGEAEPEEVLLSFALADQEFALPVDWVREIVRVPDSFSALPRSEAHIMGLMQLRSRPLPLLSLRDMLGLPAREVTAGDRIVVVSLEVGGSELTMGWLVDGVRDVLRLPESRMDEVPALLAGDQGGSELDAIIRLDDGKRMISVLAADRMIDKDAVREVREEAAERQQEGDAMDGSQDAAAAGDRDAGNQLVVFRLGPDEFATRIEEVREITRRPDELTTVPHSPDFIEGVINLRGQVLPVINLRRRFGLAETERDSRERILVLRINGMDTGVLVDGVSEVLKVAEGAIQPTPRLSEYQKRLLGEMVKLTDQKRLILILDPNELVSQQEMNQLEQAAG